MREVAKKHGDPGLQMVARVTVRNINSQEAEHIEAVVRHWLFRAAGFRHAGKVDWLEVPEPAPRNWQVVLERGLSYAVEVNPWSDYANGDT